MTCALGAALVLAVLAAPAAAAPPAIVPPGYSDSAVLDGLAVPTAVRFAGGFDDRIFVADKTGVVLAFAGAHDTDPVQVIDLNEQVHDFWDRGLLGMALAPGFSTNGGDMYLLYTVDGDAAHPPPRWGDGCPDPPGATVSGCVVSGKLVKVPIGPLGVATGPPQTLIENEWCAQFPSHTVGTVAFGPDGYLYVSAGDGANFDAADWGQFGGTGGGVPVNPCGDPFPADEADAQGGALRSQDVRTDADPAGLDGAILRLDPNTGAAAPGNPFAGSNDPNKRRVIAYGMRNPFRLTFRPGTNELWLGDVGWGTWEEIDKINVADATAENLGWPCFEANDRVFFYNEVLNLCKTLADGAVTAPQYAYSHTGDVAPNDHCGDTNAGSSISGVAFKDGVLYFADYARNCIWSAHLTGAGNIDPSSVQVIAQGPAGPGGPVELQIGPGGDLYYVYLEYLAGQVRRIRTNGPSASITATSDPYGATPLHVTFHATGGGAYAWDLDGDGAFDDGTNSPDAAFTYAPPRRVVQVKVRVTVGGQSDIATVSVHVGDTPPHDVAITGPGDGWAVGDPLHFEGSAVDSEGDPITYQWLMTVKHCEPGGGCHKHPVQSIAGPSATFTAPDHELPSHLEIRLTATAAGLSGTKTVERFPREVTLTARADTAPYTVAVNALPPAATVTQTLIAGSTAALTASAPQGEYRFWSWSDGDTRRTRTLTVRQDTDIAARYQIPPAAGEAPTVAGTPRVGATLTGTLGTWSGTSVALTRQWLRCNGAGEACAAIAGATGDAYTVTRADQGHRLRERVTAANGVGAVSADSAPTGPVPHVSDTTRPRLRLSARSRTSHGNASIKVTCRGEACRVKALASVRIGSGRARSTKAVTKRLRRGKSAILQVRLPHPAAAALRAGKRVRLRWEVTATDAAGNRTTRHLSVSRLR